METFLGMLAFVGWIAAVFSAVIAVHRSRTEFSETTESERPAIGGDVRVRNSMLLH